MSCFNLSILTLWPLGSYSLICNHEWDQTCHMTINQVCNQFLHRYSALTLPGIGPRKKTIIKRSIFLLAHIFVLLRNQWSMMSILSFCVIPRFSALVCLRSARGLEQWITSQWKLIFLFLLRSALRTLQTRALIYETTIELQTEIQTAKGREVFICISGCFIAFLNPWNCVYI